MKNMGLKVLDGQVVKVLQIYEVMNIIYLINPKLKVYQDYLLKKNEISDDFEIGILINISQIANSPLPNNGKI